LVEKALENGEISAFYVDYHVAKASVVSVVEVFKTAEISYLDLDVAEAPVVPVEKAL
jgi:hypothetical protein